MSNTQHKISIRAEGRLGEILRSMRIAQGYSLRSISRNLDITPSYLSDIERGLRVPSEEVLQELADILDLSFDDLMCHAGRFGAEADRFAQERPLAIKLFRKLAAYNPTDAEIEEIINKL